MYFDVTVNGKDLTYRLKILEDNLTGLRVERLDVVKCKKIGAWSSSCHSGCPYSKQFCSRNLHCGS
mgnify:CR=1 FL=1